MAPPSQTSREGFLKAKKEQEKGARRELLTCSLSSNKAVTGRERPCSAQRQNKLTTAGKTGQRKVKTGIPGAVSAGLDRAKPNLALNPCEIKTAQFNMGNE